MRKFQILFALLVAFAAEGFAESSTGDNRIANPSFETDEKAFNWKRMESPRRRVEAEDDPRYISRFDGEHVKRGSRSWFMRCENTEGRNIMRFNALAVTPGKPYVFKAYYRIEDADGLRTVWGNYHEHNAAGKTSGYKNLDRFSTETGKWNEFTCSFYASPESATADVELIFIGKMSVWVDEVSFVEQVEPEPLPVIGGKLPESDLFSLSWLSPLSKALPCGVDGRLEDGDGAVHLDAARNEAESFQLVLGAKRDLKNVELEVSDFVFEGSGASTISEGGNACIQQDAVKVREVLFVPVSGVSNPGMNRLHPDPVVDYSQGDAAAGSNKVFLVTVKTPADAAAGAYAGTLSLRVSGGEVVRIPVKLRVRDFVLPDSAKLKSYFYFSPSAFLNSYRRYDARPAKEICDDMYRHYRELRLTGNQAVDLPDPEWTMKDGHVVVTDWSAYEAEVERLKREFNFTVFPVPFVGMLGDNQGWFKGGRGTKVTSSGRVVGLGPKETPFGGFFDEPDGQRRVIEALSQFAERTKKRFPDVMFSWYIYDEPSEAVMDVLPKLVKAYADALPEIKFLVVHTLYADQLEHYDIRVATFNPSSINPQVRNFDTSWYYQYPAVITDSEYLRNRFFPWQVYQADGDGVLLWSVAYYGKPNPKRPKLKLVSPWLNPAVAYESAYTTLFYPPRQGKNEGVVSTIRAINIGDGIDDFDYLKLYEEKFGKENLKKLIKNVLPEATNLPSDQAAFLKLRREIAECLERKTAERSARDLKIAGPRKP